MSNIALFDFTVYSWMVHDVMPSQCLLVSWFVWLYDMQLVKPALRGPVRDENRARPSQ